MGNINNIKKKDSDGIANIVFSDIHSDEPHENITPTSSETVLPKHFDDIPVKTNTSFNVKKASTDENIEEGMIIRDNRRHKISLGTSLKNAFEEWMHTTQEKFENVQQKITEITFKEEEKIAPAETRKDIVVKASTHATLAPKDDHKIVIEKIRTYKKDVAHITKQPLIIENASPTTPTWKHFVEHTEPEKSESESVIVSDLRKSTVAPNIAQKIITRSQTPSSTTSSHAPPLKNDFKNKIVRNQDERNNPLHIAPIIQQTPQKNGEVFPRQQNATETPPALQNPVTLLQPTPVSTSVPKPIPVPVSQIVPNQIQQKVPVSHNPSEHAFQKQTITELPVSQTEKSILSTVLSHTEVPLPPPASSLILKKNTQITSSTPIVHERSLNPKTEHVFREIDVSQNTPVPHTYISTTQKSTFPIQKILIRLCAFILIVAAGVLLAVYVKNKKEDIRISVPSSTPAITLSLPASSFMVSDAVQTIELSDTSSVFLETLHKNITSASSDITHVQIVHSDPAISQLVTSKEFLHHIHAHLSSHTQQILDDEFMVGGVRTTETVPFIMFRASNFDRFFMDMLAWESYLVDDFSPLFEITTSTSLLFTDAIKNNLPVRILYDDVGNEIMLYTFIKNNTVIITASSIALEKLVSRF